jgi:hypothetical protein
MIQGSKEPIYRNTRNNSHEHTHCIHFYIFNQQLRTNIQETKKTLTNILFYIFPEVK